MRMQLTAARWPLLILALSLPAISCGDSTLDEAHANREIRAQSSSSTKAGSAAMPAELRAAFIAARQAEGGASYNAELEATGAARFVHVGQGLGTTIENNELRLAPLPEGSWDLSLRTVSIGCEQTKTSELDVGTLQIAGNRVELDRGGVREWYVNGPLGLEQGFTLQAAPGCEGPKVVTLEVRGSLVPKVEDDVDGDGKGQAVSFVDAAGVPVLRYTDLHVEDATGKSVSAWMEADQGRLALHVEDDGATYPLVIDPLIWLDQQKLTASDGTGQDYFGKSVAISGDTAIVGAYLAVVGANSNQGSAYVFVRSGTTWTEQQKLTASDGAAFDTFGRSVAVLGDTAIVGAQNHAVGANSNQGSAYVFVRNGTMWTEQQKLTASDGATNDGFGSSVAISGDTVILGATGADIGAKLSQGSAYVFVRSGTTWTQQQKLTASDGAADDRFGASVAISGDTVMAGATLDDIGANADQGSAYVFVRSGTTWTQQQKLTASDGAMNDSFGYEVTLSGDTAIVGAYLDDIGANADQGSAYVFVRNGMTWVQQQQLTASDGAAFDYFGNSVSVSGDTAIVAAFAHDIGSNFGQGSAYVFMRSGTTWTQHQQLTASDGEGSDGFGSSVSVSGDTAIVSAWFDVIGANVSQGSAYVFIVRKSNGDPCVVGTECASGLCADGVCCDSACGNGDPTDCQACSVDTGAALNGVCGPRVAGTECRVSVGACDAAEACDGVSEECPVDALLAAGTKCRAATEVCDPAESCDGTTADCPPDATLPDGTPCGDGTCSDGACMIGTGGAGGAGGAGGSGEAGAGGAMRPPAVDDRGCSCRVLGSSTEDGPSSGALAGLAFAALAIARRRAAFRV
jgi:FG-GAP repeat